ncbi:cysteine protease StiP family protein [Pontibacillus salipaludis]|uniref:cysteine protease StiP family protein n=1 Tax=Pontibacillus salipaludis TaxID=1697394 RepID=UPI0031EA5495
MSQYNNQTAEAFGSYAREDVQFLLKNLNGQVEEEGLEVREKAIQSGVHYSEMLPIEYKPTKAYLNLYKRALDHNKGKVAHAVSVVAEQILKRNGNDLVLVSLARAGTPIGILVKRYLKLFHGLVVPHYSVSIIRGRGIDENAIHYIKRSHPKENIQFIDGWTGKGAITQELYHSCKKLNEQGLSIDPSLAVLADPGHCSPLYGTREDFLIPNACLNSTVSGLVSRTVLNKNYISEHDFHGAKYYTELLGDDRSNEYIDVITKELDMVKGISEFLDHQESAPSWQGLEEVRSIQAKQGIEQINHIKPGVGETTRVLLRRVPWKVLVKDQEDPALGHILQLAKENNVPIEEYKEMSYACCGLIKKV